MHEINLLLVMVAHTGQGMICELSFCGRCRRDTLLFLGTKMDVMF